MATCIKHIGWIILALGVNFAVAEEKIETPSQKTKEAVDKLLGTPNAVRKSLQKLGDNAKARFRDAVAETKSTKTNSEASGPVEQKTDPAPASGISAVGKRDPFRPFTLTARATGRSRQNLSPLERYELGQLRLVGIVWQVKEPNAMVEDSVGLGYVIKIGTPIGVNEGKVKTITPNEVIIEEAYVDLFGARKKREVSIKLSVEKSE